MRGRLTAAVVLCGALVAAGCGAGRDDAFRELRPEEVPFDLDATTTTLPPTTTTTTTVRPTTTSPPTTIVPPAPTTTTLPPSTTSTTAAPLFPRTLYFVREGRLVAVTRFVPTPPNAAEAIVALSAGSLPTDQPAGLRSVVRPEHVASVVTTSGVARVGLTAEFGEKLPAGEQQLAIAQLVYTLTALPGIGQIAFERDAQPIDIPRADGSLASGLVTREDFPDALGR